MAPPRTIQVEIVTAALDGGVAVQVAVERCPGGPPRSGAVVVEDRDGDVITAHRIASSTRAWNSDVLLVSGSADYLDVTISGFGQPTLRELVDLPAATDASTVDPFTAGLITGLVVPLLVGCASAAARRRRRRLDGLTPAVTRIRTGMLARDSEQVRQGLLELDALPRLQRWEFRLRNDSAAWRGLRSDDPLRESLADSIASRVQKYSWRLR